MKIRIIILITVILMSLFVKEIDAIEDTNNRSKFNYEVLSVEMENGIISIEGWAFVNENQNLHGSNTHSYSIELHYEKLKYKYDAEITSHSLTDIMQYTGYRSCSDSDFYVKDCNYTYDNVGFKVAINSNYLASDRDYAVYLVIETKQTGKRYRAPLYYAQKEAITQYQHQRTTNITSTFKQMSFNVYYHTLRTSTQPAPANGNYHLRLGNNCSSSYENYAFYTQGAQFNNILGVSYYKGIIPYYQVKIQDDGCGNLRRRVKEGGSSDYTAHIPSTYVNYTGKPMIIDIVQHRPPIISASNHTVEQYSKYLPLDYASAVDGVDGDITNKLIVTHNSVETRYPRDYDVCYQVTNSYKIQANKCVRVTVTKLPVRIRYINKQSLNHSSLSIWTLNQLKKLLD